MEGNNELKTAWEFVEKTGKSVFLTGKAGTGKTTFLRKVVEESRKRVVVVAPTGIAAINAGGVTIHSFFQLPLHPFIPGAKIESKFALKENLIAMAKNFIFKPDLTPRTSLWTDLTMASTFNPLDRLASEVVEEMRNVGEILELDIRNSLVPGINPITKFYIEWFDATYYPISITNDLFNDRDTIKFMKRLNSSSSS